MFLNKIQKKLSLIIILMLSSIAWADMPIVYNQSNTFESGGPMPNFVSSEDINNDGHTDLLVSTERKLHFLMGDGNGNLEKKSTIRLNATGTGAALGDFDGDGNLDIAISITTAQAEWSWYNTYSVQRTDIYLNNGGLKPTFTKVGSLPYYGANTKIQTDDFNKDGFDDLMVDGHIMLSRGDTTFQESDSITIPNYYNNKISGIYTADINADQHIDIIYAGLSAYCGDGSGEFIRCSNYSISAKGMIADFNDDGLLDQIETKVVSFKQIPYTSYSGGGCGSVVGYSYSGRGNRHRGGRGRIRHTRCFPSYSVTRYRSEPETAQVIVKLQNENGTFDSIFSPIINGEIIQLEIIDIDADGLRDIAMRLKNQSGISILRGLVGNELSAIETVVNAPSVLNFEDFNEDGLADIVYVGLSTPSKPDSDGWAFIHLQANQSTSINNPPPVINTPPTPTDPPPTTPSNPPPSSTNFPALDPNGETLELEGEITELYADHFVLEDTTIWYNTSTTFKYETGFSLAVGESAQVEANPNVDGSGTAIKVQVGPL